VCVCVCVCVCHSHTGVVDWSGCVFANCITQVQLYVKALQLLDGRNLRCSTIG